MKIAIYGAGKCGEYVLKKIKENTDSRIEVNLFIDNSSEYYEKKKFDIPIIDVDNFINFYKSIVDCVLIAVSDIFTAQEMAVTLLNNEYDKIYLMSDEVWKAQLPILNINGEFCSYIKHIDLCVPALPYLEYHVSDYCNLKCKRCGHFSNLVKDHILPDIQEFQKSLVGLSQKFTGIRHFRLMGGEPFINPDLDVYIYKVRNFFPYTDIRIVSNGLLLPELDKKIIRSIRECGAIINISQYPPTRNMIERVIEFAEKEQLKIEISSEITSFFSQMGLSSIEETERIFHDCVSKTCYFLRKGRLHCCPSVALTYENQKFLGLDIPKESMINNSFDLIEGTENGWEI